MVSAISTSEVSRFEKFVSPEPTSGCWLWLGAIKSNGYAVLAISRKVRHAHRVFFEALRGKIPEGAVIDHLCRNRSCVNPQHMEAVTQRENVQRGLCGAVNAARILAKTHCRKGHPYEGDNLKLTPGGVRYCRTCTNANAARFRERRGRNS